MWTGSCLWNCFFIPNNIWLNIRMFIRNRLRCGFKKKQDINMQQKFNFIYILHTARENFNCRYILELLVYSRDDFLYDIVTCKGLRGIVDKNVNIS